MATTDEMGYGLVSCGLVVATGAGSLWVPAPGAAAGVEMIEKHVLNLGAGVQSTTVFLMSIRGDVRPFDAAVFADTQEEPAAVYEHLQWLCNLGGPPVIVRSAGRLGDHLMSGRNSTGGRFAAIPAFTTADGGENVGRGQRQCSKEYKTEVISRAIRRDVLGLGPRQKVRKGWKIHQYFGISLDEKSRASRIWERFHVTAESKFIPHFPLIDLGMTRADCLEWLVTHGNVPHQVPRSACVFCPFHTDAEWERLKTGGGAEWVRIVEVDAALRDPATVYGRSATHSNYLHRSCLPIDQVEFRPRPNAKEQQLGLGLTGFDVECEGVCGV